MTDDSGDSFECGWTASGQLKLIRSGDEPIVARETLGRIESCESRGPASSSSPRFVSRCGSLWRVPSGCPPLRLASPCSSCSASPAFCFPKSGGGMRQDEGRSPDDIAFDHAVMSACADALGNPFRLRLAIVPGNRRGVADCATNDRRDCDGTVDQDCHRATHVC
jgi:hypothetical protein